jgi:hypothetical protein
MVSTPDKPPSGIACPLCGGPTLVARTRSRDHARRVVRRRKCENPACRAAFETVELPRARLAELTGGKKPSDTNGTRPPKSPPDPSPRAAES